MKSTDEQMERQRQLKNKYGPRHSRGHKRTNEWVTRSRWPIAAFVAANQRHAHAHTHCHRTRQSTTNESGGGERRGGQRRTQSSHQNECNERNRQNRTRRNEWPRRYRHCYPSRAIASGSGGRGGIEREEGAACHGEETVPHGAVSASPRRRPTNGRRRNEQP